MGPTFEGRFKAVHVDRDSHLLEVCRYVHLNPVRAGLVDSPAQWALRSFRAHIGRTTSPPWLATVDLHGALMGQMPSDAAQTAGACRRYAEWVDAGRGAQLWRESLRHDNFLGDEEFVERVKRYGR